MRTTRNSQSNKRQKRSNLYEDYVNGSIVRIKLTNFVSYDSCEFFPGPYLNMIIGPNGTGKSTIVSAICIGLNWHTKYLGREKDISKFIKNGKSSATVEIELKDSNNTVTIKRVINQDKTSNFSVNKESCGGKKITELMTRFNIQIDNLCQFLPQDRVAEFAQLDPYMRLRETERAIGDDELYDTHERLIKLQKQLVTAAQFKDHSSTSLHKLEERQKALERDVQLFKEREKSLAYIELLKLAKLLVLYREKAHFFNDLRDRRKRLKEELKTLYEQSAPAINKYNELVRIVESDEANLAKKLQHLEKDKKSLDSMDRSCSSFLSNDKICYETIKSTEAQLRNAKSSVADVQRTMELLIAKRGPEPPTPDVESIHRELQEISTQKVQYENTKLEKSHTLSNIRGSRNQHIRDMSDMEREINQLSNVRQKKLNFMKSSPGWSDAFHTFELIEQNKTLFEKQAYGPIFMYLNCKDRRFSAMIEGFFRADTFKTFIMSSYNDYLKLMEVITSKTVYTPTVREFSSERKQKLEEFEGPCPREKLREFGFDGYVLDYLEGPEPVLVALCYMLRVHQIPIAAKDLTPEATDALNRLKHPNGDPMFKTYLAGNSIHLIFRSSYGNKEITQRTDPLPTNVIHFGDSVDAEDLHNRRQKMEEMRRRIAEEEIEEQRLNADLSNSDAKIREFTTNISQLKQKREELLAPVREWQALNDKIEHQRMLLEQRRQAPPKYTAEIEKQKTSRKDNCTEFTQVLLKMKDAALSSANTFENALSSRLKELQSRHELKEHEEQTALTKRRLEELTAELSTFSEKVTAAKEDAMSLYKTIMEQLQNETTEVQAKVTEISEEVESVEEVENKISVETTKLDFINVNSSVLEKYEKRRKDIEEIRAKLASHSATVERLDEEIKQIQTPWEKKLDKIVTTISAKFAKSMTEIKCAGEVRLAKNDAFDQWHIEILVKFRKTESLQALTGQRQSGGERSVSTIMYLLALQGMTIAPFQVVDEINQGMDPRNERMVHHHFVQSICEEPTSQYFLVTPKLLPELTYHRNVRVLCICNGVWLPKTSIVGMESYLQKAKALQLQSSDSE
ncbi:Smc5-6 complex SMC subunit Smc5 [Schizosaccharomyces japonicus yFS275]|uniref:Structural maintenance of chromosomes protein 5 n=1 Tax=Schizosaccharomyces japonicus (strain yFS275 / FY16936) TaxID=402676 RepID=B6K483_SCHJY|nr:Smc5-6 complex SMC subunit Smc5 [Schizosaccharomyces japonicus yFS275]EEB08290.2 Smc5-6 complex SMC subunit Smc5 [Schizosaccharomyces japonicus yFS275]